VSSETCFVYIKSTKQVFHPDSQNGIVFIIIIIYFSVKKNEDLLKPGKRLEEELLNFMIDSMIDFFHFRVDFCSQVKVRGKLVIEVDSISEDSTHIDFSHVFSKNKIIFPSNSETPEFNCRQEPTRNVPENIDSFSSDAIKTEHPHHYDNYDHENDAVLPDVNFDVNDDVDDDSLQADVDDIIGNTEDVAMETSDVTPPEIDMTALTSGYDNQVALRYVKPVYDRTAVIHDVPLDHGYCLPRPDKTSEPQHDVGIHEVCYFNPDHCYSALSDTNAHEFKGGINLKTAQHRNAEFYCVICEKLQGYSEPYKQKEYAKHWRAHAPEDRKDLEPYECGLCDVRLTSYSSYLVHQKLKHGGSNNQPAQCDICGQTYSRRRRLIQHRLVHTNPGRLKCRLL